METKPMHLAKAFKQSDQPTERLGQASAIDSARNERDARAGLSFSREALI